MKKTEEIKMPNSSDETKNKDEAYFKIWDIEQRHTSTRWTLLTFFFSVSFAIFGVSMKSDSSLLPLYVTMLIAVAIYWFTYALFLRFNDFTTYLRSRIKEMEDQGLVSLDLQTKIGPYMDERKRISATRLILLFGILYTIAGIAISIFFYS